MDQKDTALVIIDIQVGMINADSAHHTEALSNMQTLLEYARSSNIPVIYVQHDGPKGHGLETGSARWQIHPAIAPQPGEAVVNKRASDAFYETTLQQTLQKYGVKHLIAAGGQTQYCVDTTVRRATTFGYNVTLVSDAHLTFDTDLLSEEQIVAFYNDTLNGFDTDDAVIRVQPTSAVIN
ncbi:cysteine hydrolase family protein [Dictyobacter aurantiacus]|uniref:Isochorismatase n=1 Tax=Dictyobacter aurantiacus TaxID=1936993 RepID=A0A401ZFK3_9CHLR|nr:cysteine hydrolase family protein [Dictyobacter aurantiacus]GCE05664.1 isochorismatase [Dictyobacter aurantiacus]